MSCDVRLFTLWIPSSQKLKTIGLDCCRFIDPSRAGPKIWMTGLGRRKGMISTLVTNLDLPNRLISSPNLYWLKQRSATICGMVAYEENLKKIKIFNNQTLHDFLSHQLIDSSHLAQPGSFLYLIVMSTYDLWVLIVMRLWLTLLWYLCRHFLSISGESRSASSFWQIVVR